MPSERSSGDCLAFTTRSRSISGAERSLNDALYVCIYGGSDRETVINTVIQGINVSNGAAPLSSLSLSPFLSSLLPRLFHLLSRVGSAEEGTRQNNERKTSKGSNKNGGARATRREGGGQGRGGEAEEAVPTGIVTVSSADGLGMYARALALMLSGTRERAPVTPNARQQLAEETNVALLCTIRPRTKVIESVWWQGASVLGERRLYVPEKKRHGAARRADRGRCPGSFAPFNFPAFRAGCLVMELPRSTGFPEAMHG